MHTDAVEHWSSSYCHAARNQVADHGDTGQGNGRMIAIAIYDILVDADIEGDQDDAKQKAGAETRPYRDLRIGAPAQPKQSYG